MIERIRLFYCKLFSFDTKETGYSGTKNCYEGAVFTFTIVLLAFLIRIGVGMYDANDPKKCRANSINDILLSPAYMIGCNLAKDRFDVPLN